MFESKITFSVKCASIGCTVQISPSVKKAFCTYCEAALDGASVEVSRVARFHTSNQFGR